MYDLLHGLRVIEAASFVAGPTCGLQLLQYGAEVIRLDPLQGAPDGRRWPVRDGRSLYWEGLNKGKKSVAIDLSNPEGREIAIALITAPGPDAGIFLTNSPPAGLFAHNVLEERRRDLISIRVAGWADGRPAMDYTVNASFGLPLMTGPVAAPSGPTNHVLPAWDLLTGSYAATSLLAAERRRRFTGKGVEIRIPLGDIAIATLANLGQVAEVSLGEDRLKYGNALFGAFGRDFVSADNVRLMIVAITPRQWMSLVRSLDLAPAIEELEKSTGASFESDEGARFIHRDQLFRLVEAAVAARLFADLRRVFDEKTVCWSVYRTLKEAIGDDFVMSPEYRLFSDKTHPSGFTYPTPGAPSRISGLERMDSPCSPSFGEHTELVLADILGFSTRQIGHLRDKNIVGGP